MTRAVVFAYHNVGVRCLRVLLDQGVDIALVLTHEDSPTETIWYDSVAQVCADQRIPFITPDDANVAEVVARIRALAPDFLFSFYYRKMLGADMLSIPTRGALNVHGSLLPKYRGRVPVNWAVLHGERETGASLHYMEIKPDAGNLVAQTAVPILSDDTAFEVFQKVTVAAELTLARALPQLIAGTAPSVPLDLKAGSYYSGRKPEDGRIDWAQPAAAVYNLVRAVAPPYPGAFTDVGSTRFVVAKARVARAKARRGATRTCGAADVTHDGELGFVCGDGQLLVPLRLIVSGETLDTTASQLWLAANESLTQSMKQ
ncbi:MAG: formyltransferase [Burkholderiales bacterium]|nr:formyltransferase [Burkholderiales bacterium]